MTSLLSIFIVAWLPVAVTAQNATPSAPPPRSLVVGGPVTSAQPWALTLEERAAKRAAAESHRSHGGAQTANATTPFRIDGAVTPELFFPNELFTQLVAQASYDKAASSPIRAVYNEYVRLLGWQSDSFWRDVLEATAAYRESIRANPRPDPATSRRICSQRAEALTELRRRYPRFDEFLYRAVAPRMSQVLWHPYSGSVLWIESGCQ